MKSNFKRVKTSLSVILAVLMTFCLSTPYAVFAESTGDGGSTAPANSGSTTVDLYTDTGATSFPTGSEITMYTGVKVTGSGVELPNTTMRVTIPKEYLETGYNSGKGIKTSTAANLKDVPKVTSDADNFYIDYAFKTLSGGQTVELPFTFKTKNYSTPPDTTIPVTTQYFDENEDVLGSKAVTITNEAKSEIQTQGSEYWYTDSNVAPAGQTMTKTSDDPDKLDAVLARFKYKNVSSDPSGLGIFTAPKYKIVISLKNGVIYNDDYQNNQINSGVKGATYDPEAQTVTMIIDAPKNAFDHYCYVYLKCPDWTYNQLTTAISSKVIPLDADGNEITSAATDDIISKIGFYRGVARTDLSVIKSDPSSYNYQEPNKDKETSWKIEVKNRSNYNEADVAEGLSDYHGSSITDDTLNGHLYYTSFTIDKDNTLSNPTQLENNILYGYNSNGDRTEIARNLKIGQEYKIPDENHLDPSKVYRKLELVFTDGVTIKQGEIYNLTVKTKVFPQDWEQEKADTPGLVP